MKIVSLLLSVLLGQILCPVIMEEELLEEPGIVSVYACLDIKDRIVRRLLINVIIFSMVPLAML